MPEPFIPLASPQAGFEAQEPEIRAAIDRVLASGTYILGREVEAFEEAFAAYLGAAHAVGVGNGTDALALALRAVGVGPADEVITVSHSAVATAAAIEQIGAVPVFCDIDPVTRCLDPGRVEALIGPRTRAVVPVHIYGHPVSMPELLEVARRHGLRVVEDGAQAHGAELHGRRIGTFGDAAAFSFYPTKNLGALGDGGAVVSSDPAVADRARELRQYGWRERYVSDYPGVNSRLDELQAAILRVKLGTLDASNARRRAIAAAYTAACDGTLVLPPEAPDDGLHAMHLYVVESELRDELAATLAAAGIGTGLHYPAPIHLQPAYRGRIRGAGDLACTERLYRRMLSLPMFPELDGRSVERVCTALSEWAGARREALEAPRLPALAPLTIPS